MTDVPRQWILTRHALTRAYEMNLDRAAVLDIIANPETDYPSPTEKDCRLSVRGKVAVVYNPARHVVVTVLVHGETYGRKPIPPTKAVKQLRRAAKRKDRS